MRRLFNKKGQNMAEYAIVIALVIGAVLAAQKYAQRGIQGRVYNAMLDLANSSDHTLTWPNAQGVNVTTNYTTSSIAMQTGPADYLAERRAISEIKNGTYEHINVQDTFDGRVFKDASTVEAREMHEKYGYNFTN